MNDNQDTQVQQPQVPEPQAPAQPTAPIETPQETPKQEAPQFDPTEIETRAAERASKSVIEKIGEALGLTKKQEEQIPSEPKELAKYLEERSEAKMNDILAKREAEQMKALKEAQRVQNESAQTFTQLWGRQYKELAESGKVPKIEKETDPNDPGRIARLKVLTKMYEIVQANQAQGIDYVPTLKEVFYEHPDLFKAVEGADAPISGGGRTEQKSQVPGYKRSWEEILAAEGQN
jgi:hypothetical protein